MTKEENSKAMDFFDGAKPLSMDRIPWKDGELIHIAFDNGGWVEAFTDRPLVWFHPFQERN